MLINRAFRLEKSIMAVTDLQTLGWGGFFESNFSSYAQDGYECGRGALEHKNFFRVHTQHGEVLAQISGTLRHEAVNTSELPALGHWVVIRSARIQALLPRRTSLVR